MKSPNPPTDQTPDTGKPFTVSELQVWGYRDDYFVEVLNGEKSLEEAREDLLSFRNTASYTGNDPDLMEVHNDEYPDR